MTAFRPLEPPRAQVSEAPVAIVCNGSTLGVMMASPTQIEDFARGFALTEGLVTDVGQIEDLEVLHHDIGVEARFWLRGASAQQLQQRQRSLLGPVGCGLCGIDSLAKVARRMAPLTQDTLRLSLSEACAVPALLQAQQPEHDRTGASHAAGLYLPGRGIVLAREDVGRHNALDKLGGAMARAGLGPEQGAVVLTSRVSTEMVQKTVALRVPVLIAVSAATDHATRLAQEAGLTLIARARGQSCEILSGAHRIVMPG